MFKKVVCGVLVGLTVMGFSTTLAKTEAFEQQLVAAKVPSGDGVLYAQANNKDGFELTGAGVSKIHAVSGEKINISPSITGNDSGVQYKYVWQRNNWQEWGVIKDFSSSKSEDFQLKKAGDYRIIIDAKTKDGKVTTKKTQVTVEAGYKVNGITGDKSVVIGKTISFKPDVTGDTSGLQYKFVWQRNNWQEWGVGQALSSKDQYTFNKTDKTGKHFIVVDVLDEWGNIQTVSREFSVTKDYVINGINSNEGDLYLGYSCEVYANVTGKTDGLQYKFVWQRNNWQEWGVLKPMNSTSKANFVPKKADKYTILMDVQDKDGDITTVSKEVRAVSSVSASAPAANNVTVGGDVSIKANATSKVGGLKYKYVWMKDNWKHWGVIKDFSENATMTFKPNAGAGKYTIITDVKDKSGAIVSTSTQISVSNLNVTVGVDKTSIALGDNIYVAANNAPKGAKFKFVASYNNWQKWAVIKDFSTENSISFKPAYSGNLQIIVDVTYGGVTTTYKSKNIAIAQGASLEKELLTLVNAERAKAGLLPYKWDNNIDGAVMVRAVELEKKFSHTRPDGTPCFTAGDFRGEIIAKGYTTHPTVINGWMNSPGHKALILDKGFTKMSGARYNNNWVICFK